MKALRGQAGWTQQKMAEYLGLKSGTQVAHREGGRSPVRPEEGLLLDGLRESLEAGSLPPVFLPPPAPTGAEIRALRAERGLSQSTLAALLGIPSGQSGVEAVSRYEAGTRTLRGARLVMWWRLAAPRGLPVPRRRRKVTVDK